MLSARLTGGIFGVAAMLMAGVVFAQTFPNKPIRIVTSGVGGTGDFTSRLVAQGMSAGLGQTSQG